MNLTSIIDFYDLGSEELSILSPWIEKSVEKALLPDKIRDSNIILFTLLNNFFNLL